MDIEKDEEVVEVEETHEEPTESEVVEEPAPKEEKATETPEARYARLKRQTEQAAKKLGIEPEAPKSSKKSDEFGYDVKAYLKASGIKSNEFDFVKQEMKSSGQDIDSLLENDYFQSRLEKHRAIEKTSNATPKGTRSGSPATDSVDYWMAKPIEEVPAEMRIKVVNAKLAKDRNKGIFYNS
jgi:hypothetical protein